MLGTQSITREPKLKSVSKHFVFHCSISIIRMIIKMIVIVINIDINNEYYYIVAPIILIGGVPSVAEGRPAFFPRHRGGSGQALEPAVSTGTPNLRTKIIPAKIMLDSNIPANYLWASEFHTPLYLDYARGKPSEIQNLSTDIVIHRHNMITYM